MLVALTAVELDDEFKSGGGGGSTQELLGTISTSRKTCVDLAGNRIFR
jgi:hypothetical protein